MDTKKIFLAVSTAVILLSSCAVQKPLTKPLSNIEMFAQDTLFKTAQIGFVLLDEKSGEYVESLNADKYFIPASNTKLFTTYAVLKNFKDSLVGFYYNETKDTLYLKPNADPTFLNNNFKNQFVWDKIVASTKPVVIEKVASTTLNRFGRGWPWSSYQSSEMVERTVMPIYENLVRFKVTDDIVTTSPKFFQSQISVNGSLTGKKVNVSRAEDDNSFTATASASNVLTRPITTKTNPDIAYELLRDTLASLNKNLIIKEPTSRDRSFWKPFSTQKLDEVLTPMMHESNNYLAEQLLIMAGTQINGGFNERVAITNVLSKNLTMLPDEFIWADGSGLSRYNQVTPKTIASLLVQLKKEFGWERISSILQKGDQGTVKGFYKGYENNIYTKTGTLVNTSSALSGYLITKKGNRYIFSLLANDFYKNSVTIRRAFEKYITNIIETQ